MQKIVPNLWFDTQAQEAAAFYTSLFEDSKILQVVPYGESGPGEPGTTMVVNFELLGQEYVAINGGPQFPFTEAVSFEVRCDTQEEVDRLWDALTADGGEEVQCGWLKDRYGLSWQIVPARWVELAAGDDPAKVDAAMRAMLGMKKLDIAELERAYAAG
ncbi:MAG TPA: VOC family protein [Nocardioidaceae bacterium]|nr:VOC family protein [Nocardioidaceae bacterium]